MTKKLSLAALALVSTCYFTACGDDSSSSSASEENSENKADCNIDSKSDTWAFDVKTVYQELETSVKLNTVFEASSATTTLNLSIEIGDALSCEVTKTMFDQDLKKYYGEQYDEQGIDSKCNVKNGNLTVDVVKVTNNVAEEDKKEAYDEFVQVCKDVQKGDLSDFFNDGADEENSSDSQSGDLLSCDMVVEMSAKDESYTSHFCGEAANTSENKKHLEECVSVNEYTTATIGSGCSSGAKKICEDVEDGSKIYFYDDDAEGKSCEELMTVKE